IVPASLHQGGDNANALNVTYDSPIGTVSALRDGNFYYMFLPKGSPDTLAISVTGQAIRSVNPGTLNGNVVQLTYDGVTTVELKLENGRSVYVILMRSSVPALHVVLNQVSLATVHADKRIKYPGNSVFLYDPDNSNNNVAANEVEFKGRGNSSWTRYAKKGYQIKFEKRVSILGMEPAKKWILIPDAGDGSLIRNKLALEIAAASGCFAYTPHGEFVDLWISGEYRGLYAISEKVEIDKNRLALSDPKGVLVELDELFYGEDPYRTSGLTGHHYVEKEAVDETSHEGIDRFMDAMTDLERMLVTHAPWESVEKAIDVPSFAAYYIIQEFTHNAEDLYTSFFLYRDGENDVIHAGPVWDFDSCFGMFEQDPYPNTIMSFISTERRHSNIFYQLGRYPEFRVITQQIYDTCFRDQIASLIEDTTRVYYEIKNSADMNFRKYAGTLGNATWKGNVVLPTFEENYISFQGWLTARLENFVPYHFFTELSARVVQLKVSAEGILLTDFEPAGPDDPSENGTDSASAETQPAETQPPETTPPE
ncbi:MAG: CotH kinase family protein, partial [Lachnospiraceae bacterium]|nr:CotH kinase family protein [Lachnospiraceae bacterium]